MQTHLETKRSVRRVVVRAARAPAWFALSCWLGACALSTDVSRDEVGMATVALMRVPSDVSCVRLRVQGVFTVERRFDVEAGDDTVLALTRLPLGDDTFRGYAYAERCDALRRSSTPTWLTDPVVVRLFAGRVAAVTLVMRRNSRADVTVDFEDEPDASVTDGSVPNDAGEREDAALDAATIDAGEQDASIPDSGAQDAALPDAGVCIADQTRCAGNSVERCGKNGQWRAFESCGSQSCVEGSCTCTNSGEARCPNFGLSPQGPPQRCLNGRWQDLEPSCSGSLPYCYTDEFLDAACICIPGNRTCNGRISQICEPDWDFVQTRGYRDIGLCRDSCQYGVCQGEPCNGSEPVRLQNGVVETCMGSSWVATGSYDDSPCGSTYMKRCHDGWLQGCQSDGTWLNLRYNQPGCLASASAGP